MADFAPTLSQKNAIETRNRAILVSAAAGSGKTKVLTERLLARISDDADIDSFLVITYTKAAAAELKSRITEEISNRLALEPDNKRLRRQSALCQRAQIGTIHSFCAALLRENCHAAALSPEFKVIEEDRAEAIKERVIEKLMEKKYEAPSDGFLLLVDSVGRGRDDKRLVELVLKLHSKMQSHARPEKWAEEQIYKLNIDAEDVGDTVWGREILSSVKETADYWAERMEELSFRAAEYEKINAAYGPSLADTALSLRDFSRALDEGWDRAKEFLPIVFPRFGTLRSSPEPELSEYIKAVRDTCKKASDNYQKAIAGTSEELLSRMHDTAPAMKALLELTLEFDRAYSAEKRRRAEVDFSDLEHFAARLLTDDSGEPTALAREISGRFTEIMVDEYQDVNKVQDAIFRAVSKDGKNLFMVGDVKQSIYRFRLADPTIFTEKYNSYSNLENAHDDEPVRIMLQENFRSRREIIDAANHVFSCCMSEKLGEIDYDENARLKCGASYTGKVSAPELIIVELPKTCEEEETPDKTALEAAFVAEKIKKLVASGETVEDKGVIRPMRYGDIAIIMPTVTGVGDIYRDELTKRSVPVIAGQGGAFFASQEIVTVMCLLAVIDNPHQDVPLIAVLRSPVFGFTADELSEIRACDRDCDFYTAMTKHAEENEKCAEVLKKLRLFREKAPDMELGELIWYIYDELDLMALSSAMEDGAQVRYNLAELPEYAKRFEKTGYRGLHRFVEWLQKLAERGDDRSGAASGNAVQIMTVHKSKGLEFPVVFMCGASRRFNTKDLSETVLVHPELGLGPKFTDTERGVEYSTLARNAIELRAKRELLSERMRLLYVALTRAKERLFITASMKEPEKKLQKLSSMVNNPMPPAVLSSASDFATWLMYACLADTEDRIKMSIAHYEDEENREEEASKESSAEPSPEIIEELRNKLGFEYAYIEVSALPSKVTATELKNFDTPDEDAENIAPKKQPSFRKPNLSREEKKLTGAEKGTATHMVLQFIDYEKAKTEEGIKSEIFRLESGKFISTRQAGTVSVEAIRKLFNSQLGERISRAEKVRREFKFSILCSAKELLGADSEENILLQGVIDCCIEENGELTIIDYKTDRVKGEALNERAEVYAGQVRAYALAAERIIGKPVKECVLYFLEAGEEVVIKM